MPEEVDGWGTSTGLVDDVEGEIVEAQFAMPADYSDGTQIVLELSIATPEGDTRQWYSVGTGYAIEPGGTGLSPRNKQVKKTSNYGRLLEKCRELGIIDVMKARGTQWDAAAWVGLRFHWKRQKVSYGQGLEEKEVLLPDSYLGEGGGSGGGAAAPSASSPEEVPAEIKVVALKVKGAGGDWHKFQTEAIGVATGNWPMVIASDSDCQALFAKLTG